VRRGARQVVVQRHAARRLAPPSVGEPGSRRERVVERDTGAVVGAVPGPGGEARDAPAGRQRYQERHRPYQVRRQPAREQPALVQRLRDQPELELLQVPQTAVDELRRPAGGTGREVPSLDEGHGKPSRRGVERGAHAGDAAADDQHVEALPAQPVQVGGPALR
jgi:hypothetical protein